jgi:catechol 2,3-dioxygenase-like lactoylglutathione lyase family enzyme
MRTQVTFDCADPHAQARFWAEVFGAVVEDHSALVDRLVAEGQMPADDRVTVDGRSAFRDVAACRDAAGVEPRLFFQRVPEGKVAKNRVHLDVHVDPDEKAAEVQRLVGLGAQLIGEHSDRGPLTYVLRDPEGNEFCLH